MKNLICLILTGLISFSIVGCATNAKFIYPADGKNLTQFNDSPAYRKKVAVVPFEDMRTDKNRSSTLFLYLIPLMPYGWVNYDRPETGKMFNGVPGFDFNASEDLAKAAAFSLRKSGLFQDAFVTFGRDKGKADYLLESKVFSTHYKGTMWSYGLSGFAPLPWLVGLPAGTSYNELTMTLKMTDLSTGLPVWEKKYDLNRTTIQGLFYNLTGDVRGYSGLMQEIMNDAVEDMNRELQRKQVK